MLQSTKVSSRSYKAVVGKYVLDSISLGMYDNPLIAIREYIQNSADAIDDFCREHGNGTKSQALIEIQVDGRSKSLEIKDNGTGIPVEKAQNVLHDLGRSEKDPLDNRGFRGIGRLGGLGYCDELRFSTKAEGENVVSTSRWDCVKLKQLISENNNYLDASHIVERITTFEQENYAGPIDAHFFVVEMNNFQSSRNVLLNVPAIKSYLSQVAPVPFHPTNFRFSNKIDDELRRNVPSYETYSISVNGEQVYKPYINRVNAGKSTWDEIDAIGFFNLSNNSGPMAFGWLAELNLLGMINPSTLMDGLRVRLGNILIGDKDIISELYREKRFSNYMLGEIHVVDKQLVPNSRRDDFEDNGFRDDFHTCFIREIGLPYSKKIREVSNKRSRERKAEEINVLYKRAQEIIEFGYVAELQKQEILERLREINGSKEACLINEDAEALINKIINSEHTLNKRSDTPSENGVDLYKNIFETIYQETSDRREAELLIKKILNGPLTYKHIT